MNNIANCSKASDKELHIKIGKYINQLRKHNDMTICDLAKRLGISENRVSRYLHGYRNPTIPLIVIIECAKIFDISLDSLVSQSK